MGTYIYSALSPKNARLVEVERPDGTTFETTVYVLAYTYKPSLFDSLDRDLTKRFGPVIERREQAWEGLVIPQHAAVASGIEFFRAGKKVRMAKLEVGAGVLMWEKHAHRWSGQSAEVPDCPLGDSYNYSARRSDCTCTPEVLPGKLCVRDDPDWGRATSVGIVKRIIGAGEVARKNCEHGIAFTSSCQRCAREVRGA